LEGDNGPYQFRAFIPFKTGGRSSAAGLSFLISAS
jgi:hypothetical protein